MEQDIKFHQTLKETELYKFWQKRTYVFHYQNGKGLRLDLGCGRGKYSNFFPQSQVIGLDPTYSELIQASCVKVLGAAEFLPFKSQTFNAVMMNSVLDHLRDMTSSFLEIKRVLKPNGVITITQGKLGAELKPRDFHRQLSMKIFLKLLKQTGFNITFSNFRRVPNTVLWLDRWLNRKIIKPLFIKRFLTICFKLILLLEEEIYPFGRYHGFFILIKKYQIA